MLGRRKNDGRFVDLSVNSVINVKEVYVGRIEREIGLLERIEAGIRVVRGMQEVGTQTE